MTLQLQQAITLAQTLSIQDQLELLKTLSTMIQHSHALTTPEAEEEEEGFSIESFSLSWHQAMTGQTLPLAQLWED